jgi:twitching motility protein PilT
LYEIKGVSRFRGNFAKTSGAPAFVFRVVPYTIPSIEQCGLPVALKNLTKYTNGLVLVTGPTGSGKSTTLATILEYINQNHSKHIITAEEPIEFIYQGKKSVFKQRQVGMDTPSFPDAIKYALRQDPDIILVGEIRDKDTASEALKAAETGHLVFSTLHTIDAVQTISRIINFFEPYEREEVKSQIAEVLRCSIAQKLLPKKSGSGRIPALEIMTSSVTIRDYILKDELLSIYELIAASTNEDMISLNKYLMNLLQKDIITEEVALEASENKNELRLMLQGTFHGAFN